MKYKITPDRVPSGETEIEVISMPDNTNGAELTEYAAELCCEINNS